VLLKALGKDIRLDLGSDVIPLIDTVGKTLEEGLELLSRVGLNDVFLFVRYGYRFTAPPEMYGKKFLFWQSEKIWEINLDRTLTLQQGFSCDSWWMNYG